jgi:hypothetical protein
MNDYWQEYEAMRSAAVPIKDGLLHRLVTKCQENPWLKIGGADFEPEGFCCDHDYPYYLERYDDREMLKKFFEHGNWGIRAAVMHGDLIFVNQVNGGDEWWTLKVVGDDMVAFESLSAARMIENGSFDDCLDRMLKASLEKCKALDY